MMSNELHSKLFTKLIVFVESNFIRWHFCFRFKILFIVQTPSPLAAFWNILLGSFLVISSCVVLTQLRIAWRQQVDTHASTFARHLCAVLTEILSHRNSEEGVQFKLTLIASITHHLNTLFFAFHKLIIMIRLLLTLSRGRSEKLTKNEAFANTHKRALRGLTKNDDVQRRERQKFISQNLIKFLI